MTQLSQPIGASDVTPTSARTDGAGTVVTVPPPGPPEGAGAFIRASGVVATSIRTDRVVGYIELDEDHHTPWGIVHGGVYATAVESAASLGGTAFAAERGLVAVGTNNTTNFLRPLTHGRVDVIARAIQQGRTQQLWQVDITDAADRLIATGQLRLANVAPPAGGAA
jgi:1,4-dihydroxy-2-naphthoyl-CoA hydrolase